MRWNKLKPSVAVMFLACGPQPPPISPAAPNESSAVQAKQGEPNPDNPPDLLTELDLEPLRPIPWSAWPTKRPHITSYFGPREDPVAGERVYLHRGVDFRGKPGDPVYSVAAGRVLTAEFNPLLGNLVVVDHGYGLTTWYGHQQKLLVSAGQTVVAGTQIGEVGSTGRSQAPHLHFAVKRGGVTVDPLPWLRAPFPVMTP